MCDQKIDKVNVTQMKKEMELTYITWNKKESHTLIKLSSNTKNEITSTLIILKTKTMA